MARRNLARLMIACALAAFVVLVVRELIRRRYATSDNAPIKAGEPPKGAGGQQVRELRNLEMAYAFHHLHSMVSCEEELRGWAQGRAFEKLAFAEAMLWSMANVKKCNTSRYEWKPGTDDLSLPAGRTKWGLEHVLGVKLPGIVDRNVSQEDLQKLHGEASRLVEAFRQGIMALAADQEPSPEEFARLKRKYKGRIVPGCSVDQAMGCISAMDELLVEWPPVGRKYEDLVDIIGARAEKQDYGLSYRFQANWVGMEFILIVQDGVIRSAGRRSVE